MAPHSSVLAWKIPGTGEPGGLPSMGSHSRTWLKWLSSSSSNLATYRFPNSEAFGHTFPLLSASHIIYSDIPCCLQYDFPNVIFTLCKWNLFFLQFPSKSDSYALHKIFYLPIHYSILSLCFSNRSSANSLLSNMETGSQEPKEMTVWNWHRQECKTDQGLIRETCSPPRFPTQYSQIVPETKEKHEINSWCGEIILTDINMY